MRVEKSAIRRTVTYSVEARSDTTERSVRGISRKMRRDRIGIKWTTQETERQEEEQCGTAYRRNERVRNNK